VSAVRRVTGAYATLNQRRAEAYERQDRLAAEYRAKLQEKAALNVTAITARMASLFFSGTPDRPREGQRPLPPDRRTRRNRPGRQGAYYPLAPRWHDNA
jgi:hypothetical protein